MSSTGQNSAGASASRWAGKPPAVLCDFDDTTAEENVASLLLSRFSDNGTWERLRQAHRERQIGLKEYQERAFRTVTAGRDAMQAHVKEKATLRPYFKDLWGYCRSRSVPLAIVTVGLDFYVEALLEREGLQEVPRYAVQTEFTPQGIIYNYPHPWESSGGSSEEQCGLFGNCKCRALMEHRRRGHTILYVGDGRSDFCPASIADQVFAHGPLTELMDERRMPYTPFRDFRDMLDALRAMERPREGTDQGPSSGGST
jgi:2,3-diketo-5-methylthio-1-phosphopentane phosphatase